MNLNLTIFQYGSNDIVILVDGKARRGWKTPYTDWG